MCCSDVPGSRCQTTSTGLYIRESSRSITSSTQRRVAQARDLEPLHAHSGTISFQGFEASQVGFVDYKKSQLFPAQPSLSLEIHINRSQSYVMTYSVVVPPIQWNVNFLPWPLSLKQQPFPLLYFIDFYVTDMWIKLS